jgi:uncharacterized protein involved in response to NO
MVNDPKNSGAGAARPTTDSVFFSHGFRPFFFFAGIWSALAVLVWVLAFAGVFVLPSAFDPISWHGHEMVFGYAAAAIAGFLFTSVPNWTGRPPLSGTPLVGFAVLWLAGRVAVLFGDLVGVWPVAIIDIAFLVILAVTIGREIIAGQNRRNLAVVVMLSLLASANILMHLEPLGLAETTDLGLRLGIGIVVALITLIGGRVTPSFTAYWLRSQNANQSAISGLSHIDRVGLVAVAAARTCSRASGDFGDARVSRCA